MVAQMLYGVQEHQTVGQLETGGEDVGQKSNTAHDPAPTSVRVKVLKRSWKEESGYSVVTSGTEVQLLNPDFGFGLNIKLFAHRNLHSLIISFLLISF